MKDIVNDGTVTCGEFINAVPRMAKFHIDEELVDSIVTILYYISSGNLEGVKPKNLSDEDILPRNVKMGTAMLVAEIGKFI